MARNLSHSRKAVPDLSPAALRTDRQTFAIWGAFKLHTARVEKPNISSFFYQDDVHLVKCYTKIRIDSVHFFPLIKMLQQVLRKVREICMYPAWARVDSYSNLRPLSLSFRVQILKKYQGNTKKLTEYEGRSPPTGVAKTGVGLGIILSPSSYT